MTLYEKLSLGMAFLMLMVSIMDLLTKQEKSSDLSQKTSQRPKI